MSEEPQTPWEFYMSQHDWLSHRFSWATQHLGERFLDLDGFIDQIKTGGPERMSLERSDVYVTHVCPYGFYEVEPVFRVHYTWLIYIFTVYERRVRALCRLINEVDSDTGPTLSDLEGNLTQRVKAFFAARLAYDVARQPEWSAISDLQKVRDCIIHCGGNVTESRDEKYLRKLASTVKDIDLSPYEYLRPDEPFCRRMEQAVLGFMFPILDEAHANIRKKRLEAGLLEPPGDPAP